MTPTTAMASAIGMRRNASSIIAASPMSASVIALRSGSRGVPRSGHKHLEDVYECGERDQRRHEVDKWPHRDAQHVRRVAIRRDAAGLYQHLPREEEKHGSDERVNESHQRIYRARRQHAVDEVHGDVLVAMRHERQPGEDQNQQRQLGHLEAAADRAIEEIARHHVDEREAHHGEEQRRGGDAEDRVGPPLPAAFGFGHARSLADPYERLGPRLRGGDETCYLRSAVIFLISARNSSSTLRASNLYLSLAFFTQSSMIGCERLCTSATKRGSACTILTLAFFNASMPFWSAASQDWPLERAAYSYENLSMIAWSCLESFFHLSSFMKKPNAELYMPPGKTVACCSTVSSLKETMDSKGKNTPSATPELSSS